MGERVVSENSTPMAKTEMPSVLESRKCHHRLSMNACTHHTATDYRRLEENVMITNC